MDDEDLINPERMAIFEQKMRELTLEFIETLEAMAAPTGGVIR